VYSLQQVISDIIIIMKKVLLTGGAGYIGSHTAVELQKSGYDIVIVDNYLNSNPSVISRISKITGIVPVAYEVDLRNAETLNDIFQKERPDIVIHFAGHKAVGESVMEPLKYYDNNLVSTLVLLQVMKQNGVNNLIFSSSATVYGDHSTKQYTEDMPTGHNISSPYGKTKYMIEEILKDYSTADSSFNVTILRYFNPVGAHESGLIGESPLGVPNNLLPIVAQTASGERDKVLVFGNNYDTPDGTCIRDYVHVVDVATGHIAAISGLSGLKIYNLGRGAGDSVLDVIHMFERASRRTIHYEIVSRRQGDLPEFFANTGKAFAELGWKAEKTLYDSCRDLWNWQKGRARNE
jgi:UDP-glucose 4-epimerase